MGSIEVDGQTIKTSKEDKVFFPGAGYAKKDLIEYYRRIAEMMLPHVANRPIVMHRFPDGIEGKSFFNKNAPRYFPGWIATQRVDKENGTVNHVVIGKTADLAYLANQACIAIHIWLSRRDKIEKPDRLIFDLDPPNGGFDDVRAGAKRLREILEAAGLKAYAMATGSKGMHVACPIKRGKTFDQVRAFAQQVAGVLATQDEKKFTTEQRIAKRGDRVFIDTNRNAYGQTAVAPYSVRARPGAPVAVPLEWSEVDRSDLRPDGYNISNVLQRLGRQGDPWKDIDNHAESLPTGDGP